MYAFDFQIRNQSLRYVKATIPASSIYRPVSYHSGDQQMVTWKIHKPKAGKKNNCGPNNTVVVWKKLRGVVCFMRTFGASNNVFHSASSSINAPTWQCNMFRKFTIHIHWSKACVPTLPCNSAGNHSRNQSAVMWVSGLEIPSVTRDFLFQSSTQDMSNFLRA